MSVQTSSELSSPPQQAWWAIYTRHQHEKTVAEVLAGKGFEVFLPLHESMRRWKDRQKLISLPLFPCYVFVRGELSRRLQVVSTPGIHMVLSRGEQIEVIPNAEIDAIRRAVLGSYKIEPHPYLKVGERVRVTRGSLEGVEGILVRRKNLYRLVLSVEMVAQSVGVEVSASDVEPVGPVKPKSVIPGQTEAGIGDFQKNFPSSVSIYDARLDSTRLTN
ncbi:MAG TPA: UpxY family transcription antiterminator [Acidobacteriaceae bacterium]|jgi:transcription antitermination factor NusG|nr:UpxY family transcription antiterminator [Acidobacteriaceae bacterium]